MGQALACSQCEPEKLCQFSQQLENRFLLSIFLFPFSNVDTLFMTFVRRGFNADSFISTVIDARSLSGSAIKAFEMHVK